MRNLYRVQESGVYPRFFQLLNKRPETSISKLSTHLNICIGNIIFLKYASKTFFLKEINIYSIKIITIQ